jgi:hypothetical protein
LSSEVHTEVYKVKAVVATRVTVELLKVLWCSTGRGSLSTARCGHLWDATVTEADVHTVVFTVENVPRYNKFSGHHPAFSHGCPLAIAKVL